MKQHREIVLLVGEPTNKKSLFTNVSKSQAKRENTLNREVK